MVEIKVTGNTAWSAMTDLVSLAMMQNSDVCAAANRILEAERHKETQRAAEQSSAVPNSGTQPTELQANPQAPADLPPESYAEEPPFPQGTRAPGGSDQPEGAAPAPALDLPKSLDIETVRAAGIEAARKYGQPAVKAILERFKVPNMTSLAESDWAAFMEALKGLGDGNA